MKNIKVEDEVSVYSVKHRFVCKERRGHKQGDRRVGEWHRGDDGYDKAEDDANTHSDKYPDHEVYVETRQERRGYTKIEK